MVGQMIGVEAVRLAQEAIGEERAKAAATADALGAVAAQDAEDRDLPGDIERAEADLATNREDVARRLAESSSARQALEAANLEAERVRARSEQDRALATQIAEEEAARGRLEARIEGYDADLARLADQAKRRELLAPLAATQGSRQTEVERWSAEHRKQLQIDERARALRELGAERSNIARIAQRLVTESATSLLPDWTWTTENEPGAEIGRLLALHAELDPGADRQHLTHLETVLARKGDLDRAESELTKYRERIAKLRTDEQTLLSKGDPAVAVDQFRREIEEQRTIATRHETERGQALERARQLQPLVISLQSRTFDDHCPTCGRSITEAESAGVIATLVEQIEGWNQIAQQRTHDARTALAKAAEIGSFLADTERSLQTLTDIRNRLASGEQLTREKGDEVERLRQAFDVVRGDTRSALPTAEEIEHLRHRVEAMTAVAAAAQGLTQRFSQLQELALRETRERDALVQLGEATYDAVAHRAAVSALDEANGAITTLANIDRELARRDAIAAQRAESATGLDRCNASIRQTAEQRAALAYRDEEAAKSREAVSAAIDADRTATSRLHLAQTAEREKQGALNRLRDDLKRLEQQLAQSAALRKKADELSQMYREFGIFDQFVAQRIAPRLAEQTSELLELATDGKFSNVAFDENYGIEVYDGINEKFPLESFSGGERDVVALCARLALSQLIGSSAAHPPSFLVLDEVFGALDRDRRVQLLELLGRISESIETFQQMFIISHVDDVRSSPIFSRVIRITEGPNGSSQIEDATVAASFDE
jgi:DNA repair exonuclease SbcCD ATPase subunit